MSRPLAESVYVAGRFYAAGDVPGEEIAALITNPRAWGDPVPSDRPSQRVHVPTQTTADDGEPQGEGPDGTGDAAFDPGADGVSVDDVNNHLANADAEEIARVMKLEADGKARKGVLEGPYAPDEPEA